MFVAVQWERAEKGRLFITYPGLEQIKLRADSQDEADRWVGLPIVHATEGVRPFGWIPPDPFRWVGYHAYTAMTGRSPRRG